MTPVHHLDETTVVSYVAGALPLALSVVATAHLEVCASCRKHVEQAERIAGALMEQQRPQPVSTDMRASMWARLDDEPTPISVPTARTSRVAAAQDPDHLPACVQAYFGATFSALRWRTLVPGVQRVQARDMQDGSLMLLKIAPGKSMPVHSHGNSELTQILRGAYDDALGHFAAGDIADMDSEIEHQPVTAPGEPCICLAAMDASLRFTGPIARLLQPVLGF